MNTNLLLAAVIRILGIGHFISALISLIYFPTIFLNLFLRPHIASIAPSFYISLLPTLFAILVQVAAGAVFWKFAPSISNYILTSLGQKKNAEQDAAANP